MRKVTLLFAVLLSLVGVTQTKADELTVYDGTTTNQYIPIYGYYADESDLKGEYIIPASDLSALSGKIITGLKFYSSNSSVSWGNYQAQVFLKEVSNSSLTALIGNDDATTVYTGSLAISGGEMAIVFSNNYTYEGGNLLVGIYTTTKGTYNRAYFYGTGGLDTPMARYQYGSTGGNQYFIPKTTFTYESATPTEGPVLSVYSDEEVTNKVKTGDSTGWGLVDEAQSVTYYLKNTGTEAITNVAVNHRGNAVVSDIASSIAVGNKVALTITQAASGSTTDEIIITADNDISFTISVSGTIRDDGKLWCNFAEGLPTGWTNGGISVSKTGASDYAGSSEGGYVYDSGYGYSLTTPLLTFDGDEKMYLLALRTQSSASYCDLKVEYSANGTSGWEVLNLSHSVSNIPYYNNATSWISVEISGIPLGNYFIRITPKYIRVTDIYGGTESTAPVLALSQASYDFGLITEVTTTPEAITITNTGKSDLTGMTITSDNANFTVSVTDDATSIAANGGTATFTVTMNPNVTGAQSATITIKSDNADDLTFTVTGAVAKEGITTVDFNDNALPSNWSKGGNTSFTDGAAYFYYSTNTLTSPKLNFVAGDFLIVKAKISSNYGYVTVKGSVDGTSFTQIKKLDNSVLNQTDYTTCVISEDLTSYKYIQLDGYYCYVDEISGLTYAPILTVQQGDATVTTPASYDFGECGEEKTVTYNLSNSGAGTISITGVEATGGFITNWTESVDAPFDLVITLPYDSENAGEKSGTVTVTTTEGEFVINLTGTTLAADAPKMAIYVGEELQGPGAIMDFGIITEATTKEFVIKNDGTGTLNIASIVLPDGYSIDITAPTEEAPIALTAGQSQTVKLTLAADQKAIRMDKVVIWPAGGLEDYTLGTSATVMPGAEVVDFNDNALPNGWTNASWTFANGAATGKSKTAYLTTSKLKMGENDFIIVKAMAADAYTGNTLTVLGSTDNGTTFSETLETIEFPANSNTAYTNYVISNIPSTVTKIRFVGYYAVIDDIAGLTYDDNDPRMGIYTDAECTVAAATSVTKDLGFVSTDATATYYIKNDGTGTMTLALGDAPSGFTQNLDKTSVAAGEKATLTITMTAADNAGFHSGNVVVTATDLGTFTVTATGVVIDEDKLNLDFATDNIPTTWTANNWSKNASGYIETSGYGSTNLETTQLTATAGEEIVIVAKQTYASSSYTFGVNYKKVGAEEWRTLIAAANIGTSWTTLHAPIAEAGDYLLQFTGSYAQIQHIYGLTEPNEPVMVVYDGENAAAAAYSFGSVANNEDAVKTFTVKNEGKAVLAGLSAVLSGDQAAHYDVAISGLTEGGVAAGESATIIVTQKKDNLGAHAATLTISSTSEGIADFVIALSGTTRDASKLYVDFAEGIPATWTATSWSVSSGYAQTAYSGTCTLQTPALTIAAGEELSFDLSKQYNNNSAELKVRYTTDGGVTWSEQDLTNDLTYGSFTTKTLTLGNENSITAVLQFVGTYYARLDNFCGGSATTAPMIALTENGTTATDKDFGNLTAEGCATYTLTNSGSADMVTTIATTGVATADISGEGEGITIADNKVTLAAGMSATITLTLPYEAPFGEKEGTMTLTSEGWVGDLTLNYTATTIDPTAVYIDFAENSKPAGFYSNGWTYTSGYAANTNRTEAEFITSELTVAGTDDVLTYQARAYNASWYSPTLTVSYSTDRKNWTELSVQPTDLTNEFQSFEVKGLEAGKYYLKFQGSYVYVDNIMGWHYATPAPAHDLFFVSIDTPEDIYVPGSTYTATVKVANLRAASETVAAELYIKNEKAGELTEQTIALDETKTFEITGTVPEEGKHLVYVKVYNDEVTIQSDEVTITSANIRSLEITDFALTSDATVEADDDNKFTAIFNVTVKNASTVALAAEEVSVTVMDAEGDPYETVAATKGLAIDGTTTIPVTVNTSALEGGVFTFKVQENLSGTTSSIEQTVTVNALAPKFELAVKDGATVADGDAVAFGLVKAATTKTYTITNTGKKALELVSIVAPAGFSATALTDENKTIAVDGTLDIDVTLAAEQGKVNGELVFTYKVDDASNKTFTLNLTGRSVSEDTWTVDFEDNTIPADWDNSNGWTVYESNGNHVIRLSGWDAKSIMTPRLAATRGEVLTFDVLSLGNSISYAYSTDKQNWSDETVINSTGEQTFTAPTEGNYYLRFTGRNAYLDNFVGFKLNPLAHDTELAASSIPATGKQYNAYTATVTLKENVGKAEEVTAELYVNGEIKATQTQTITANGSTIVTLTWEPEEVIEEAVKAYVQVTGTEIDLTSEEVDLTIAEVYTLDEATSASSIEAVSGETILLKRSFIAGWNTVCLPFTISDVEAFFGEGAEAFEFTSYADGALNFTKVTSLTASYPYVVYVPTASTEAKKLTDITISSRDNSGWYKSSNEAYFRGTYAPIAAPDMAGKYGVTKEAKIAKGSDKASMKGFRAYFELPNGSSVKALSFDDGATGVRTIRVDELDGQIFDLSGRKINKTQQGIYIVNGKKVSVK